MTNQVPEPGKPAQNLSQRVNFFEARIAAEKAARTAARDPVTGARLDPPGNGPPPRSVPVEDDTMEESIDEAETKSDVSDVNPNYDYAPQYNNPLSGERDGVGVPVQSTELSLSSIPSQYSSNALRPPKKRARLDLIPSDVDYDRIVPVPGFFGGNVHQLNPNR